MRHWVVRHRAARHRAARPPRHCAPARAGPRALPSRLGPPACTRARPAGQCGGDPPRDRREGRPRGTRKDARHAHGQRPDHVARRRRERGAPGAAALAAPADLQAHPHHAGLHRPPRHGGGALFRHAAGGVVAARRGLGPGRLRRRGRRADEPAGADRAVRLHPRPRHPRAGRRPPPRVGHRARALDKFTTTKLAYATFAGGLIITVLIWIVGFLVV